MDTRQELVPTATVRPVASRPGIAVVMPAYNEEANIRSTVEDFLRVLDAASIPHTVVVCDDGSHDKTGMIAEELATKNPGRVVVVRHTDETGQPRNRGYGAAVRSALAAGLASGFEWVLATDADGQFHANDLPDFLNHAIRERYDMLLGCRTKRADPWKRRFMGKAWTWLNRALFRIGVSDVDCGYKLIRAEMLAGLTLRGEAAVISPELVAKVRAAGGHVGQCSVGHYPRQHGEQTGSDLRVVMRSLIGVMGIYSDLVSAEHRWNRTRRAVKPRDVAAYAVTLVAVALSVTAFLWYYLHGQTVSYPDAVAHLEISRRVVAGSTPGLGQFGTVWLPAPHLLELWGTWNPWLYYSGIAGSMVSMAAYVVTARFLYKLTYELSGRIAAGLVAASVFMLNPNVLYMQSTPMTETLLLACITLTVYYLTLWSRSQDWRYLAGASVASLVGCATRYEAWVLLLAVCVVVLYVAWRRSSLSGWRRVQEARTVLIGFAYVGAIVIPAWMAWGWLISKDPFDFQSGAYAKPSLWVAKNEQAIGSWPVAARTYLLAMVDNMTWPLMVVALAGLGVYLWRTRLRAEYVAPLSLLVFVPFFIYSLYSGERPLHVEQINHSLYNVRFGLVMVLAAAIFTGYLVGVLLALPQPRFSARLASAATGTIVAALAAIIVIVGMPATAREGAGFRDSATQQANAGVAQWLRQHYDGGLVLMQNFGNGTVEFDSHVKTQAVVYEGSNKDDLWRRSLKDPEATGIRWIYMRRTPEPDGVWKALNNAPQLQGYYEAYHGTDQSVFRLGKPPVAPAQASAPLVQAKGQSLTRTKPAGPRMVSTGRASWFYGRTGVCAANGVAIGAAITVTNPRTKAEVRCLVRSAGPGVAGRVVNLSRADFSVLAPPDDGLVPVQVFLS